MLAEELLEIFQDAQSLEAECDLEQAFNAYMCLIETAEEAGMKKANMIYDDSQRSGESPPPSLILSMAHNAIGGFHIDQGRLREAQASFRESLKHWARNAMAMLNLGDLEREHGDYTAGLALYEATAKLKVCEEPTAAHGSHCRPTRRTLASSSRPRWRRYAPASPGRAAPASRWSRPPVGESPSRRPSSGPAENRAPPRTPSTRSWPTA